MGLIHRRFTLLFSFLSLSFPLFAIPKLRLGTTVVGPISVNQGSSAGNAEVEVYGVPLGGGNVGSETGGLQLALTASTNWVRAQAGSIRNCRTRDGQCIPVTLSFSTTNLQTGRYSASVTVASPNAVDAPQTILVMVQVGGGVPASLDFYLDSSKTYDINQNNNARLALDGSEAEAVFYAGRSGTFASVAGTQNGGDWLKLFFAPTNSFDFMQTYRVRARRNADMPEGTYRASIRVQDSQIGPENKTLPVTLQVTSQPIAATLNDSLRLRLGKGGPVVTRIVPILDAGQGNVAITDASVAVDGGGTWLKSEIASPTTVKLTFTPEGVETGMYKATLTVATNAINASLKIPIELEIVDQAAPAIRFQGVMDLATFTEGDVMSAGGLVAAFGEQLSQQAAQTAPAAPFTNEFADVQVYVNDQPAPVYFTSPDQVNFQVPYDVQPGEGTVRIDRGGQRGNSASAYFLPAVPKLLRMSLRAAGISMPEPRDYYAYAVNSDGTLSLPREFNVPNSRPSVEGEVVTVYGLGFGAVAGGPQAGVSVGSTESPVLSDRKTVFFGALALGTGTPQEAEYVGLAVDSAPNPPQLAPGLVGLYQIRVQVPYGSPKGDVPLRVQLDSVASEFGYIAVE